MKRRAFTLTEVMVVVLIIAIIAAIAVPQWVTARGRSQQKVCMTQLREMESAKEMFATESRLSAGDTVVMADIFPSYLQGTAAPQCPGGGTYTLQTVGTPPTCSLGNAAQNPHKID